MKYRFIDRYRSEFRVERMCKVLEVSRSGYYGWRKRPSSRRQRENEEILMEIQESHKRSKGTYGSPRVTADIRAKGIPCGKNRVARIMRTNGIVARSRRKFKATTGHFARISQVLIQMTTMMGTAKPTSVVYWNGNPAKCERGQNNHHGIIGLPRQQNPFLRKAIQTKKGVIKNY